MFENLIETRAARPASLRTTLLSVVVHSALIASGVIGTLEAKNSVEKPVAHRIDYVATLADQQPPQETEQQAPPPDLAVAPPPRGFQVLVAPVRIPDVLPAIDLTKRVTDPGDFTGEGKPGGFGRGIDGDVRAVDPGRAFQGFEVEKQVAPADGSAAPRYPDMLRAAGVEGEVLAQFVVDTSGRVEPGSLRVLRSSHDLFSVAVRQFLTSARYYPAEIGGRRVKQLVQQPFNFALVR
jgi:periplasmic protein TonB